MLFLSLVAANSRSACDIMFLSILVIGLWLCIIAAKISKALTLGRWRHVARSRVYRVHLHHHVHPRDP